MNHHRRRPHPPHHRPRPRSHHPHPHPHRRCRRRRHHATLLTYLTNLHKWNYFPSSWHLRLRTCLKVKTHSSRMTRSSVQSLGLRTRSTGAHWCRPPWQKRRKRRATRIANQTRRNMFHLVSSLDEPNWNTRLLKPHWHKTINPSKRRCIKVLLHHWTIAVPNPPSLLSQALHQPWHSRPIHFISPPFRMHERSLFHHTVNLCALCAYGSKKG